MAVRSHADTLRIVRQLRLESRVRLVTEHFLALPSIVAATDLAAIIPRNIAAAKGGYAIVEPDLSQREFVVSLHCSWRFEADPGNRWRPPMDRVARSLRCSCSTGIVGTSSNTCVSLT